MRLGVFGGTFDPVHLGHLILAERCREEAGLDTVLFMPAARPPHKLDRPLTAFHHRAEIIELAVAGNAAFRVDRLEEERAGPSYTAHTLEALAKQEAGAELFLIIGSDTLVDLPQWHQPARVMELATLLVVARLGAPILAPAEILQKAKLPASFPLRLQVVAIPLIEISSRELRDRVAQGRSVRYELPRSVEMYIREKRLYVGERQGSSPP